MKTTEKYKRLASAKNILGDFATFNFSIVVLAAQVNRKIESDIEFTGHRDQVTCHVYSRKKGYKFLCQNDAKTPGFCFC